MTDEHGDQHPIHVCVPHGGVAYVEGSKLEPAWTVAEVV